MAWTWPGIYTQINQGNTWNGTTGHKGLDIHLKNGDPVFAPQNGKVAYAHGGDEYNGGYARMVSIDTQDGYHVIMAHLLEPLVSTGQSVKKGQIVGYGDSTGKSSGPHLHFEVRKGGGNVDPLPLFGQAPSPTTPPPGTTAPPGSTTPPGNNPGGGTITIPGIGTIPIPGGTMNTDIFGFGRISDYLEQIDWFKVGGLLAGGLLIFIGAYGLVSQEGGRAAAKVIGEAIKGGL